MSNNKLNCLNIQRHISLLLSILLLLNCCGRYKGPGKEVSNRVENIVRQSISRPNSYVSISTWIYPAVSPNDDLEIIRFWMFLPKIKYDSFVLKQKIYEFERNEEGTKKDVIQRIINDLDRLVEDPVVINDIKTQYNNEGCFNKKDMIKILSIRGKKVYEIYNNEEINGKRFGWRAVNKYQAINENGKNYIKTIELFFNPEMTEVLFCYDSDDEYYQEVRQFMTYKNSKDNPLQRLMEMCCDD